MLRRKRLVSAEQVSEMFVHCPDSAGASGGRPLQFRSAIYEPADGALQRNFACRSEDLTGVCNEVVERRAAVRHDQRDAARARFGSDHAKRFRFTTVD
jgi:hypothetical protein